MKTAVTITVSDHAIIRYIERKHRISLDQVREKITGVVLAAANVGAKYLNHEGQRYVINQRTNASGMRFATVTTVLDGDMRPGKPRVKNQP